MKLSILVAALIASVALAVPADAASKKRKKVTHRAPMSAVQSAGYGATGVYVGGELVGRDPDPSIRSYIMRDPKPWEGND